MVARRHRGFRLGDLSEELGLLLLRSFCAVAPVPRSEDVGVDAVATLLEQTTAMMLMARESFYIQLKSATTKPIEYEGVEVEWLSNLRLPFFIGVVERSTATMSLYATHALSQLLVGTPSPDKISMVLEPPPDRWNVRHDKLCIGPPVLTCDASKLEDEEFCNNAFQIMRSHIHAEQSNLGWRKLRHFQGVLWETGDEARLGGSVSVCRTDSREDMQEVFKAMVPHIQKIASDCISQRNHAGLKSVVAVMDLMKKDGVNADLDYSYHGYCANFKTMQNGGSYTMEFENGEPIVRQGE